MYITDMGRYEPHMQCVAAHIDILTVLIGHGKLVLLGHVETHLYLIYYRYSIRCQIVMPNDLPVLLSFNPRECQGEEKQWRYMSRQLRN